MLDQSLKEQLLRIFEGLEASYVFDITVDPGNASRGELLELLEETAACSERIDCRVSDGEGLQFRILRNGEDLGIRFRAVPNGHEFSSLLLAVVNADGKGKNLPDEALRRRIETLDGDIGLTTYMSLTCTNCPDVVQALNLMAILNPRITHTIVDGALFEDEVARLEIQAVPAVFCGGETLHVGRGTLAELLEKLEQRFGTPERTDDAPVVREYDLAAICASVTVLEFMETLKADQVLQDKVRTLPNVEVHTNMQTLEVQGDGSRMTALRVKDRSTDEERVVPLDGMFIQIGLSANSALFAETLATNRAGEIVTDKDGRTSVAGIYGAGDVTDVRYKQIVIAMGEGAKAALAVSEDRIKGII